MNCGIVKSAIALNDRTTGTTPIIYLFPEKISNTKSVTTYSINNT
jgi:hypothetical protein